MFDKTVEAQESGDRWLQQRAQYRREALQALRAREGLDGQRDTLVLKSGVKILPYQSGHREWPKTNEVFDAEAGDPTSTYGANAEFRLLGDADPALVRELDDLVRDAENLARSEQVAHFGVPQGPVMLRVDDDEELDRWMQAEMERKRAL